VKRSPAIGLAIAALCLAPLSQGQRTTTGSGSAPAATTEAPEVGIPVTDPLVVSKCGTCHVKDAKGNLSRISYARTTPEGWEEAIKRMVRLNGLKITPEEGKRILKYLATYHGLAPEEAKPVMYMAEHRMIDETNIPNDAVRTACAECHAFGRPLTWRRSKDDWQLLENMHVALYAQAETHFRRSTRNPDGSAITVAPAAAGAAPTPEPGVAALDFLSKNAPLHTPEWAAWRARLRAPKIAGKWLVTATVPGHGIYFGDMMIEPAGADDEFKTTVKLKSVKDGTTITRTGQGIVYAGYSWRGRSKGVATPKDPDDLTREARETMWIAPDQSSAEGRWYWGDYQEFGFDVKLVRGSSEPTLSGVSISSIKAGSKAVPVKLYGDSIPAQLTPADLDFGSGVKVTRIVSHTASELVAEVEVAADAVNGLRDVELRRSTLPNAIAVYDKVDYIKVTPETALARLGSDVHPKGYQQFEAIGFNRGADGKMNTADDINLGTIEATWSVEEFYSVYGDDDKAFVGHLSETALFTPASDGPNPERKFSRNNYGNVWVVATAKNDKDKFGKPLTGKSYLVVSVPTYIKWDQPEVNP